MSNEILTLCDHVVSAALNGVYQGVFVTILVGCGLRLLGRGNAATRHAAWLVTLALVVSFLPAHYLLGTPARAAQAAAGARAAFPPTRRQADLKISSSTAAPLQEAAARADGGGFDGTGEGHSLGRARVSPNAVDQTSIETRVVEPARPAIGPRDGREPRPALKLKSPEATVASSAPGAPGASGSWSARLTGLDASRLLNPVSWNLASAGRFSPKTGAALVALWIILAGARAGALLFRLFQIRALKRACHPASPELERRFREIRHDLKVARPVELRVSTSQATPILLGFLHPVILLPDPEPQASDPEVTDQILQHELAHARRRDDCVNLLQHGVQAVFFFHPAVWWIGRQLSLEREIACDDCVLQQGHGARSYALALANLASRLSRTGSLPAPGVSSNKSQLKQRINMILNTRRDTSPRLAKAWFGLLTSTAAAAAVLAVCSFPRLVLAQDPSAAPVGGARGTAATSAAPALAAVAPVPASATSAQGIASDDQTPPGIEPGPKPKDAESPNTPLPPTAPAAPPAPEEPTPAAEPSVAVKSAGPVARPRGPRGPATPGERALMERIDRLERKVQLLLDREDGHRAKGDRVSESDAMRAEMDKQRAAGDKWRAAGDRARAEEQAKRAEWNEKRKTEKSAAIEAEAQNRARGRMESSKIEMGALRQARENLARELEKLDQQIERLERDQQRLEEDSQRRRDGNKPGNDRDGKSDDGASNLKENATHGDIAVGVDVTVGPDKQ